MDATGRATDHLSDHFARCQRVFVVSTIHTDLPYPEPFITRRARSDQRLRVWRVSIFRPFRDRVLSLTPVTPVSVGRRGEVKRPWFEGLPRLPR
jgi:hypothetical protein